MKMVKTRSRKSLGKQPLPGERQGTSGATAGSDSMRDGGGRLLNRRAPAGSPEETTADNNQCRHPTSSPQHSTAAESVSQVMPETTKAGKVRQRMKWTSEINEYIMRCYYRITNLESDATSYRQQLYLDFQQKFPNINVTEQRIADQRRVIVRNNLIPGAILERIKQEVALSLQNSSDAIQIENNTNAQSQVNDTNRIVPDTEENHNITVDSERTQAHEETELGNRESSHINKLADCMEEHLLKYTGMNPTKRPRIPKIQVTKQFDETIEILNNHILPKYINTDTTLTDIHTLIYSAAITTAVYHHYKIHKMKQEPTKNKKQYEPAWQRRLENDISKLREKIGWLTQYIKNNRSPKLCKKLEPVFKQFNTHTKHEKHNEEVSEYVDTLKQKLAAKARRLSRYKMCTQRKVQNNLFLKNEKLFYRNLTKGNKQETNDPPQKDELKNFWSELWSKPVTHNETATWISEEDVETPTYPNNVIFCHN